MLGRSSLLLAAALSAAASAGAGFVSMLRSPRGHVEPFAQRNARVYRSRWPGERGRSGAKLRRMAAEGRIGLGHPR